MFVGLDKIQLVRMGNSNIYRLYKPYCSRNNLSYFKTISGNIPLWEGSREECRDIIKVIRHREKVLKQREQLPELIIRKETHVKNVSLSAIRFRGGNELRILLEVDGKRIGESKCLLNGWQTDWILGEQTINGGSSIERKYQRKGLGTLMLEVSEELMGLPRIPHGSYQAPGSLSTLAKQFYKKRVSTHKLPGFTSNQEQVQLKNKRAEHFKRLIYREKDYLLSPLFASFTAEIFNENIIINREGSIAWNRINGKHWTSQGFSSIKQIKKYCIENERNMDLIQLSPIQYITRYITNRMHNYASMPDYPNQYRDSLDIITDALERCCIHVREQTSLYFSEYNCDPAEILLEKMLSWMRKEFSKKRFVEMKREAAEKKEVEITQPLQY